MHHHHLCRSKFSCVVTRCFYVAQFLEVYNPPNAEVRFA